MTGHREPPRTTPAPAAATAAPSPGQAEPPAQAADADGDPGDDAEARPAHDTTTQGSAGDATSACEQAPWLTGAPAEQGASMEELEAAVVSAAKRSWPDAELVATVLTGYARGKKPVGFSVTLAPDRCFRLLGAPEPPGPVYLSLTIEQGSKVRWSNEDRGAEELADTLGSSVDLPPRCHCTGPRKERVRLTARFGSTGRLPVVRPGHSRPEPRQPVAVGVFAFPARRSDR